MVLLYGKTFNKFLIKSLKKLVLPPQLVTIGDSCFYNCVGLKTITIPATVTSINNSAFRNCYGIKEYHLLPTNPPTLGTNVFISLDTEAIIYVPYSSDHSILNEYTSATNWASYADYM